MSFDSSVLTTGLGTALQDTLSSIGPVVVIVAGFVLAFAIGGWFVSMLGRARGGGRARA